MWRNSQRLEGILEGEEVKMPVVNSHTFLQLKIYLDFNAPLPWTQQQEAAFSRVSSLLGFFQKLFSKEGET